ncbi:MAG: NUDIX hydrolase [Bdellovibrionales bacterium]
MAKHWKILDTKELIKTPFFTMVSERCELPDGRLMSDYYRFELSDWVQIVPITKGSKVQLIRQYRHGNREFHWEIPGGVVDEGESADQAAARELLEETGSSFEKMDLIISHNPNPALQKNFIHCFLAMGVEVRCEQSLDEFEDIEVKEFSLSELKALIQNKEIKHSLVLASLLFCLPTIEEKINGY